MLPTVPDPTHPALARYLASLPQGVDSYPECTVRAATLIAALDLLELEGTEGLPEPVRALIEGPPHRSQHVREVHNLLFFSWLRDARFDGDEAFLSFTDAAFRRFYARPLYRVAFMMGRPDQVASASRRIWAWVRRGTRLEVTGRGHQHVWLRITSPPHLFDALHARVLARGLAVAYRSAHGLDSLTVTPHGQTPTELRLKVGWD
jgi:hypothetical protein